MKEKRTTTRSAEPSPPRAGPTNDMILTELHHDIDECEICTSIANRHRDLEALLVKEKIERDGEWARAESWAEDAGRKIHEISALMLRVEELERKLDAANGALNIQGGQIRELKATCDWQNEGWLKDKAIAEHAHLIRGHCDTCGKQVLAREASS